MSDWSPEGTARSGQETPSAEIAVLNMMLSDDFDESIEQHRRLGLHWMDLWGEIYGAPSVDELEVPAAERAARTIQRAGLEVYCLSTRVFDDFVEQGEEPFRAKHLAQLERSLLLAEHLHPRFVRLIAGRSSRRETGGDAVRALQDEHSWVADVYREAVGRITDAGYIATIENEARDCFLATGDEFVRFFDWLGLGDRVRLTWDVQNNWQMGVFPSRAGYERIKHLIGYVHVKGGRPAEGGTALMWASELSEAGWPVAEILDAVVADGVSPVICLNPPHGEVPPGAAAARGGDALAAATGRDIEFLRRTVPGIR